MCFGYCSTFNGVKPSEGSATGERFANKNSNESSAG